MVHIIVEPAIEPSEHRAVTDILIGYNKLGYPK